ncbi:kinetochore-associated Ndc80 complex subunit spc24 [Actinomortierella ambigua]|uniref:Kinetochore protein Spc24 n=1 Tax=Actinomortierella ambigua TaxID=1343610 RepID=A0A9P6PUG7_9FUNG|nr:kinetochore-associated Ndc80 complex subunit spc24 [Actinomortierella ambigua]
MAAQLASSSAPASTTETSTGPGKEDPTLALLRAVKDDFQGPDRITPVIAKFKNDLREYDQLQEDVQKRSHEHIKNLSRQLALLRESSTRERMDPESVHHDELMIQYEREMYAKANAIQGLEQDISSLETQIQKFKLQALRLDSGADPENLDDPMTFNTASRSGVSANNVKAASGVNDTAEKRRSLSARTSRTGQELEDMMVDTPIETEMTRAEREQAATVLKLHLYRTLGVELVEDDRGSFSKARIRSKNDVHLVKLDDELSPYFQTNLLWDLASK